MSYLGNSPGVASQRVVTNRVANEGQIRISADSGYVKGYVDVIINGTDMVAGVDFTEVGDGINVDMAVPLNSGDTIKLVSWIPRGLTDGYLKSEADALMTQTLGLSNFRNRIINGDMRVAQRGNSFTTTNGGYTLDRFSVAKSTSDVTVASRQIDIPDSKGLTYSLRQTVTTADTSIASGEFFSVATALEGFSIADLIDVDFVISFWVRSSKVGIHCITLKSSGGANTLIKEYTINTANTWEYKTIPITGGLPSSVTSWAKNSSYGVGVGFTLACGSSFHGAANTWLSANLIGTSNQVNCLDTVGNIFAITGVQLEKGSVASSFEFRPYQVELAMCQRYYQLIDPLWVMFPWNSGTQIIRHSVPLSVSMRVAPTVTMGSKISGTGTIIGGGSTTSGLLFVGNGTIQDVVGYSDTSASAEF